jgi:hypothetical protein
MLRFLSTGLICVLAASYSKAALLTDIAADYSSTQGGNGYSYGSLQYTYGSAPDDSTFTTVHMPGTASATGYFGNYASGCCGTAYPQVQAPITANDMFDQLLFHGVTNPNTDNGQGNGNDGAGIPLGTTVASVVRWTSTYTGYVTISGDFRAYNFCCAESQSPYVFVNGVAVIGNQLTAAAPSATVITNTTVSTAVGPQAGEGAAGFDSGATNQGGVYYGPDHKYSFNIYLTAGETVDWVSDPRYGFYGDLTLISGQVNSIPEPASLTLLGLGAIGLLRRRSAR